MSELHDGDIVKGRIVSAWMAKSKAKGTPSVHLIFDCNGEEVHTDIWLSEKAMGMARQQLKAIGVDIDRVTLGKVAQGMDRLKGRECDVEIQFDEWQGNVTVKCQIPTGGGKPTVSELDALTAGLRAAKSDDSKATPKDSKPSAPPPPSRPTKEQLAPLPGEPDDIPF